MKKKRKNKIKKESKLIDKAVKIWKKTGRPFSVILYELEYNIKLKNIYCKGC